MREIKIKVLIKDDNGKEFEIYDIFPRLSKSQYKFVPSNKPDFVLFNQSGNSEYLDYKCVRVSIDAERYTPDFNICDYAISDDLIQFGDRHFRMPYLAYPFMRNDWLATKEKCNINFNYSEMRNKDMFCNFIYSNGIADDMRKTLFDSLSEYKFVHSGGGLFNNIGYRIGGGIGNYDEKLKFQSRSKFTLAIENIKAPGYTTEKILHAFKARTVPIYWGNPMINEVFNSEAFIDCNIYNSLEEIRDRIIEIDSDDEKYIEMINRPIFNTEFDPKKYENNLNEFLGNIFNQEPQDAYRRAKLLHPLFHEGYVRVGKKKFERRRYVEAKIIGLLKKLGINNTQLLQKYKKRFFK